MKKKYLIFFPLIFLFCSNIILPQAGMGRGRVFGKVVDDEGNPVPDALIVAESLIERGTVLKGVSDKKGDWAIAGFGTGPWRITASKEGYMPSSIELRVSEFRNPPVTFTLKKIKAGPSALSADKSAIEMLEKAENAMKEERYDDAITLYNQLIEKFPSVFQLFLNIGYAQMKKGDLDSALNSFQVVLKRLKERDGDFSKEPETAFKAFTAIGEVWIKKDDFEKARESFEEALKISPKDEALAYSVGDIYFTNQKVDEAIKYFELAVSIKPDWWKPYSKLGYCYLNKGDIEKALQYFKKALEVDPNSPEAGVIKGIISELEKMIKKG
jgi:Tfp pilus assembly protein PilF